MLNSFCSILKHQEFQSSGVLYFESTDSRRCVLKQVAEGKFKIMSMWVWHGKWRTRSAWKYHTLPFGESQASTTICYLETAKIISNIYIVWKYSILSFLGRQNWGAEMSNGSHKREKKTCTYYLRWDTIMIFLNQTMSHKSCMHALFIIMP